MATKKQSYIKHGRAPENYRGLIRGLSADSFLALRISYLILMARAHSHSAVRPAWMLDFGRFDFQSYPQSYPRFAFRRGRRQESHS